MKLLIVDDEVVIRQGVQTLLEKSGFPITSLSEAKNGKEALRCIKNQLPDIVITDIRMPVMDGLELSKRLSSKHPDVELVILTGYADFQYAQAAVKYGVLDYILKPISQESINDTMMKVLLKHSSRWAVDINSKWMAEINKIVSHLIKELLAENKLEMKQILDQWKAYCFHHQLSFIKIKKLMGYFHFLFKTKMITYYNHKTDVETPSNNAFSIDDLFADYYEYLLKQLNHIQQNRIPRSSIIIQQVVSEIHHNYADQGLNIKRLAEHSNISNSYLSKIFRETMNVPITQYISEYRLEKARERLESDKETKIIDICFACGFNDYPYFSKFFKRTYGISPLQYREKVRCQIS